MLLPDANVTPPNGSTIVRFAHVAPNAGGIDIYILPPGSAITGFTPNFTNLGYGANTAFQTYSAGEYHLVITLTGTTPPTLIYDSGPRVWIGGRVSDALIYSRGSGQLVNMALMDANAGFESRIVDNVSSRVKAVNAAPQTGNVNLQVDGTARVNDLAYKKASGYVIITPGTRTFGFEATATPGAIVASATKAVAAATDTSVFITGLPGALQAITLADVNQPPLSGGSNVRFVQAAVDVPAVDITVGTTKVVSGLAPNAASNYVSIVAGTYAMTITNAATGAPVIVEPVVTWAAGSTYTVYLMGTAAAPATLNSQDN
jgi:hypothetical protein